MNEILTVIITLDNGEKGLAETLYSIERQTFKKYKVVVVADVKTTVIENAIAAFHGKVELLICKDCYFGKAANYALTHAATPYVMFMNSYDRINKKFMARMLQALENNHAAFAVSKSFCINPLMTNKQVQHILSKNYIEHKLVYHMDRDYQMLTTALNSCVFKTSDIAEIGFNEMLPFEAGCDMVMKLLINKNTYIAVPKAKYQYYAPRENQILYHVPSHDARWYKDSLVDYIFPLLAYAKERKGAIPKFLQLYCVYYMNCRMMANKDNRNKKILLGEKLDEYLELVGKLFQSIDDYYLLNQDMVPYITKNPEVRCMYLRLKYGKDHVHYDYDACEGEEGRDLQMLFKGNLISALSLHRFSINMMNYIDGNIWIDGSLINIFQYGNVQFYAKFNGKKYIIEDTDAYSLTKYFGIPSYRRLTYHLRLPLNDTKKLQRITFYAQINGEDFQMKISFANHWAKLSKSPRYSYWRFNNYFCHHADNGIDIKPATKIKVLIREIKFQLNLIKNHKKNDFTALLFRWLYWITHPYFKRKKIWLMLDKLYKGGDSCEYLYRYCADFNDGVTKYYLINSDTSDYRNLVKDGYKPLRNGSLLHKLVFVNADIVLITNSHLFPFNGYTKKTSKYIRGLCNFGSMCLQHGLSVQKCAIAQRRIIDNTMMYFLASRFEYENLSKHAYGYEGFHALKLTGIGRYDGLKNNDKKQILLSPTWRMYNALPVTTSEGEQRGYNPEFKHTTYFHVYNNLINDEKLIACAKACGYKIKFLLHPILSSQLDDFTPNSELEVIPSVGDLSYEKILTESSLMVTDYSGVQFDFAYMRKPIVYFHPEELPPHYDDGIFFYDTMGFGEICTRSQQLVDTLCDYMEHGCVMKDEYRKRADNFYEHSDHNNCERIYQEIMNYQEMIDHDKLRKK